MWQPGIGTEDGLMGISHQLYTCLPRDPATDFSLRVEAILLLELQPFDTYQTLTIPAVQAALTIFSERVWLPSYLLDKSSIMAYKTRLVANNRALRGDFQKGDTFACLFLCLGGGHTHSKAAQSDSPIHSDPHIVTRWFYTPGFLQHRCLKPGSVRQEVLGTIPQTVYQTRR